MDKHLSAMRALAILLLTTLLCTQVKSIENETNLPGSKILENGMFNSDDNAILQISDTEATGVTWKRIEGNTNELTDQHPPRLRTLLEEQENGVSWSTAKINIFDGIVFVTNVDCDSVGIKNCLVAPLDLKNTKTEALGALQELELSDCNAQIVIDLFIKHMKEIMPSMLLYPEKAILQSIMPNGEWKTMQPADRFESSMYQLGARRLTYNDDENTTDFKMFTKNNIPCYLMLTEKVFTTEESVSSVKMCQVAVEGGPWLTAGRLSDAINSGLNTSFNKKISAIKFWKLFKNNYFAIDSNLDIPITEYKNDKTKPLILYFSGTPELTDNEIREFCNQRDWSNPIVYDQDYARQLRAGMKQKKWVPSAPWEKVGPNDYDSHENDFDPDDNIIQYKDTALTDEELAEVRRCFSSESASRRIATRFQGMDVPNLFGSAEFRGSGSSGKVYTIKSRELVNLLQLPAHEIRSIMPATVAVKQSANREYARAAIRSVAKEAETLSQLATIPNAIDYYGYGSSPYPVKKLLDKAALNSKNMKVYMFLEDCSSDMRNYQTKHFNPTNPKNLPMRYSTWLEKFLDMSRAVRDLHALGYAHRDLKPGNFLWCNGNIKLTDFGDTVSFINQQTGKETIKQWRCRGTFRYQAPETMPPHQNRPYALTPTDIFSLGVIMYIHITLGILPWQCERRKGDPYEDMQLIDICRSTKLNPPPTMESRFFSYGRPKAAMIDFWNLFRATISPDPAARPHAHQVYDEFDRILAKHIIVLSEYGIEKSPMYK